MIAPGQRPGAFAGATAVTASHAATATRSSVAGDHPARNARTGIAGRLAAVIVGLCVHDDRAAEDVRAAAGAEFDIVRQHVHRGDAVGVRGLVRKVAGMALPFAGMAVGLLRRIEMAAGAAGIRRAAVAVLVEVETVGAVWLEPGDATGDVDALLGAGERKGAGNVAAAGRREHGVGAGRRIRLDDSRRSRRRRRGS